MWMFFCFVGCAIKSGVTVMQAEKAYQSANTVENQQAVYEWTMVESYMQKAREEYAESSFEDAELLALEAIQWMEKAAQADKSKKENW